MPLVQAVLSFEWRFDDLRDGGTRLPQRITLAGENAEAHRSQVATFAANLPDGMNKIAGAMAAAHAFPIDTHL
jgi:hypothetical protein